jgi:hypothetical protein
MNPTPSMTQPKPNQLKDPTMSNLPTSARGPAQQAWRCALLGLCISIPLGLAACGGGAGGADSSSAGASTDTSAGSASSTPMTALVVPDSMSWSTSSQQGLALNVIRNSTGDVVPDATVSLFTLSRTAPDGIEALDEPVPISLLESGATDASGSLRLGSQIPVHLTEVLVVVSKGEASLSQPVAVSRLGELLTLKLDF